jgi:hypothetical protein
LAVEAAARERSLMLQAGLITASWLLNHLVFNVILTYFLQYFTFSSKKSICAFSGMPK